MSKIITVCLIIVGLINFVPVIGLFSAAQIEQAYSVPINGNDVEILLRHRALLFGIIGGFILYSAFKTQHQKPAMLMAVISMTGFLAVVLSIGGYNESLYKILIIDVVGLVFLGLAAVLKMKEVEK